MNISRSRAVLAVIAVTAFVLSACGGSDDDSAGPAPTTSGPDTSGWQDLVAAGCNGSSGSIAAIPDNDGTAEGIATEARAFQALMDGISYDSLAVPDDVQPTLDQVAQWDEEARGYLDDSVASAEAGDTEAAQRALHEANDRFGRSATAWALAGAQCAFADPARVGNADLTIPLEMQSEQITAAFDSIWVAEEFADRVVRLDPDSGEVLATIDVGDASFRMQPADGSLWVRTASAYVEIDPDTNEVTRTLAKADVGPAANRSWAVDGALWICDGRQLHRLDPADFTLVATIDLQLDCQEVWASADLVVASTNDEDPVESGAAAAAFVDPATNTLLATVPLPADVGGPAVLPDVVFFAGYGGTKGAVIDRATWTVSATPDLGVPSGGSANLGVDGDSIYIVGEDHQTVLRVDSTMFTVTDTFEPLGVNALLVDDGALWVAMGLPTDTVQRFDLDD